VVAKHDFEQEIAINIIILTNWGVSDCNLP